MVKKQNARRSDRERKASSAKPSIKNLTVRPKSAVAVKGGGGGKWSG